MPKLKSLSYVGWDGVERHLDFSTGSHGEDAGVHTTLLTGHNGSYKSTILQELVTGALGIRNDKKSSLSMSGTAAPSKVRLPVICVSGSMADRFPFKDNGGHATEFAVPNYVYIGQRVGSNLLSKKKPLETALTFALDYSVRDRVHMPFFWNAHRLAGIRPGITFSLRRRVASKRRRESSGPSLREYLQYLALVSSDSEGSGRISTAIARDLLANFPARVFEELERLVSGEQREKLAFTLHFGFWETTERLRAQAIRLGLLTDELELTSAHVESMEGGDRFSIYDLSSGEYHILTTLLALGFSLRNGAIVLIDEPENSLHPQWQREFMEAVQEMTEIISDGHVVISTHSPLIVAAAPEGSTIVDLSHAPLEAPAQEVAFGASADEILVDQFGVASSRNPLVIDLVQRAVRLIETDQGSSPEFTQAREQLEQLRQKLSSTDPLMEVITALLMDGEMQ